MGGDWVSSDRDVAAIIKPKVRKYASVATDLQVPLVVVLGADPRLPLNLGDVQSAMRGQLTFSMTLDPLVGSTSSGPFHLHQTDRAPVTNVRSTHTHRLPFTEGFTGQGMSG
jgi:hypothetical protein